MHNGNKKIFAIGYSDNTSTSYLLNYLFQNGVLIDGVIFPKNQIKRSWKRLVMKIKVRGFLPAIMRVIENLIIRKRQISKLFRKQVSKVFFVEEINSDEVRDILINNNVGLLLLTSTPIIKPIIIEVHGLKILNAHTGWLPNYRGLDANIKALRDGHPPGVSIHKVTEKIDAGEIYIREKFEVNCKENILNQIDKKELELAGKLFVEAIKLYRKNMLRPIVTPKQLSKYEPPLTIKEKKRILKVLRKEALQV